MDVLILYVVLLVSIWLALKRLFSGKVVWGLFNVIFTIGSFIAFVFFELHRNWVADPPQKELDYLLQEIRAQNPFAYLIVALFVIVIYLAIYNWKQVVLKKREENSFELIDDENKSQFELKFWFEHGGGCIWSKNSKARNKYGYPVTNEDLPLSKELIDELNDLEIRYSRSLDWSDPRNTAPWSIEEKESFRVDAHKACEKLVEELGDGYLVIDDVDYCIYDNKK